MEERGYLGNTKYPKVQDDTPTACNTPPSGEGSESTGTILSHQESNNANTSLMYTIRSSQVSEITLSFLKKTNLKLVEILI